MVVPDGIRSGKRFHQSSKSWCIDPFNSLRIDVPKTKSPARWPGLFDVDLNTAHRSPSIRPDARGAMSATSEEKVNLTGRFYYLSAISRHWPEVLVSLAGKAGTA